MPARTGKEVSHALAPFLAPDAFAPPGAFLMSCDWLCKLRGPLLTIAKRCSCFLRARQAMLHSNMQQEVWSKAQAWQNFGTHASCRCSSLHTCLIRERRDPVE